MYILAINPGSTSTKTAVYKDKDLLFKSSLEHLTEDLAQYKTITEQYEMRKTAIIQEVAKNGFEIKNLSAVVGRGGILPPVKSGAYEVNDAMIEVLRYRPVVQHVSNLGGIIAKDIADELGIPAYIYDSVAVDELEPVARITGVAELPRYSMVHTLNMRAAAMKEAQILGKPYNKLSLIVVHLGGGITLSIHKDGKMIDNISDDEGPFSPERSGRVPLKEFIKICYAQDEKTVRAKIRGQGGLISHLNTNDAREVEKRISDGDEKARIVYEALGYQIAKGIGELATVVNGKVDAIVITGGIAYSKMMTDMIAKRVSFIAPISIIPGENELEALAYGALRVLKGEEKAHIFVEGQNE